MADRAGFENRCSPLADRGFESRPLRCAAYFGVGGIRTPKGVGKEFSHVVGVTGAKRRQRGRAPMEIRLCGFGFQSRPLRWP